MSLLARAPMRTLALLLALVALALLVRPGSVSAQAARPDPDQGELERRVAALQASQTTLPPGTVRSIAYTVEHAADIRQNFSDASRAWRRRAARYLDRAEAGHDPFQEETGKLTARAYRSPISTRDQSYSVYLPPNYDPTRRYPLFIALHGGSSNGNLFLGVIMGQNLDWETYDQHLHDEYTARWTPDWIVVAPTGFGQVMWRYMGEQDVLDVLDDVQRHYPVDPERIVLAGLSNGGVGTYAIGTRHAWRFSHVQAMAGAPSWLQYLGRTSATDRQVVTPWSGLHLAENSSNTRFYYYHGLTDGGPMRPEFVREFSRRMQELGVPNNETWLDAGHDILNMAMRHGRRFDQLTAPRDPRPAEVRMVSGDYRAARQHWIEITRFAQFNTLGRARGRVNERALTLTTENVSALRLHVSDMPFTGEVRDEVTLTVDGHEVYRGPREALGTHLQLARVGGTWRTGLLPHVAGRLEKRPGLSGPVGDAYFGRIVHVYGTQREGSTADLRAAAERGSRGFLLWGWDIRQEVIPDTDAGQPQYRDATLMLYGAPGENAVLDALADRLPIRMDGAAVVVGQQRYAGADVGVRYIYPNPDNPAHYVIVSTGVNAGVIRAASNLPEFLPDWFVYNQATVRNTQPRVAGRRNPEVASGFFDDHWQLPGATTTSAGAAPAGGSAAPAGSGAGAGEGGGDDDETPVVVSTLPVPRAPAVPGPPARFLVPETDPAGPAARAMWQRIPEFFNFRAHIPGAEWRVNTAQQFAVRPEAECLADLVRLGVPARRRPDLVTPVPSPVELLGPVDGVWFLSSHSERPILIACEMAARLPALVAVLKQHGVEGVEVLSAYREEPFTSFHTMGMALDINRLYRGRGWLSVQSHYEATPDQRTCSGPQPAGGAARVLRRIACDLYRSGKFQSVLTPNYNEGHRDHFHIDIRPDDPRAFLR
ncbi:MAG: extensin family protein [Sandaracinaceae bacterium]|nr:extensin family protein [Sandaracinaceae bacterium]